MHTLLPEENDEIVWLNKRKDHRYTKATFSNNVWFPCAYESYLALEAFPTNEEDERRKVDPWDFWIWAESSFSKEQLTEFIDCISQASPTKQVFCYFHNYPSGAFTVYERSHLIFKCSLSEVVDLCFNTELRICPEYWWAEDHS